MSRDYSPHQKPIRTRALSSEPLLRSCISHVSILLYDEHDYSFPFHYPILTHHPCHVNIREFSGPYLSYSLPAVALTDTSGSESVRSTAWGLLYFSPYYDNLSLVPFRTVTPVTPVTPVTFHPAHGSRPTEGSHLPSNYRPSSAHLMPVHFFLLQGSSGQAMLGQTCALEQRASRQKGTESFYYH